MEHTRAVGRAALLRWHALPDEHDALQREFSDLGTEVSACSAKKEGALTGALSVWSFVHLSIRCARITGSCTGASRWRAGQLTLRGCRRLRDPPQCET